MQASWLVGNSQLCTMHESTEAHGAATKKKKFDKFEIKKIQIY
jgi:hypothetical protein